MNTPIRMAVGAIAIAAVAAAIFLWPKSATQSASAGENLAQAPPLVPALAHAGTIAPEPEHTPAKRSREPIQPKIPVPPGTKMEGSSMPLGPIVESAKKRAQLRVDRELQSLKRAVPGLRPDQEQRIREELERNMPKIAEQDGALVTTISGKEPALDNDSMKEVYAKTLDAGQQQALDALLDGRKRTHDEAEATRGYTRAIESLPDLSEDQKNSLHDYYLNQAGSQKPTREQQQQALSAFLSPEEVEILGDTSAPMIGGNAFNLGSFDLSSNGGPPDDATIKAIIKQVQQ